MSTGRDALEAELNASDPPDRSELTQAVREFTALVRQRRRKNLTEVEIAELRSLLGELVSHFDNLTPQP